MTDETANNPIEELAPFYVYRLFDVEAVTLYVGKGSTHRFREQKRNYRAKGEILRRFKCEKKAYAYEREMIAALRPELNKCPGGNGGMATKKKRPRRQRWEKEMERIGTQAYVARFLLTKIDERNCVRYGIAPARIARLREVVANIKHIGH